MQSRSTMIKNLHHNYGLTGYTTTDTNDFGDVVDGSYFTADASSTGVVDYTELDISMETLGRSNNCTVFLPNTKYNFAGLGNNGCGDGGMNEHGYSIEWIRQI